MSDDPNPFSRPASESNPYTPSPAASRPGGAGAVRLSDVQSRGMVGQIPVLGILMIVQGVFILLMSLALGFYAFLMPIMFRSMREEAAKQGGNAPPMPQDVDDGWFGRGSGFCVGNRGGHDFGGSASHEIPGPYVRNRDVVLRHADVSDMLLCPHSDRVVDLWLDRAAEWSRVRCVSICRERPLGSRDPASFLGAAVTKAAGQFPIVHLPPRPRVDNHE
mgnify:CR=1 FL=1